MARVLGHTQSWLDDELAGLARNTYDNNLDKDAFQAEVSQVWTAGPYHTSKLACRVPCFQ